MALAHRRPTVGLIHHTDRGPQYSARRYREQLATVGIRPSMSGMKSAYDNAVAESFFSNLKNELVHHRDFVTRQTLGYRTPEETEREWSGAQLMCPEKAG